MQGQLENTGTSDVYSFTVISDMHIGAETSRLTKDDKILAQLIERFKACDDVVLNGDTLEISHPFSIPGKRDEVLDAETLQAVEKRIQKLLPRLKAILEACPHTRFHYMLGNHDGFPIFHERLTEFAKNHANLNVYEGNVILGDALFVHGDLVVPPKYYKTGNTIMQDRLLNKGEPGAMEKDMYRDIYDHLNQQGELEGITRIFIGHTHLPVVDYRVPGATASFYNTGGFSEKNTACIFTGKIQNNRIIHLEHQMMSPPGLNIP